VPGSPAVLTFIFQIYGVIMAKLSKCRTCSHTVSTRAKHCPNCGEGKPGARKLGRKGLMAIAMISLAFAAGMSGPDGAKKIGKQMMAWADQATADARAQIAAQIEPAAGGR
jgi:hypothetical protein